MDARFINTDRIESKLCFQKRNDLQFRDDTGDLNVRRFARLLSAMDSKVADFYAETKWNSVQAPEVDTAAGNSFELSSDSSAYVGLERIGCHVPGHGQSQDYNSESDYNDVSPDFSPRRDLSVPGHSPWPLKSARMLLAARSCWIQLSKRSLICC